MKLLAEFPRAALGHLPTPLEPMPRVSADLGGPRIWVKRDDCTGLGMGGNKVRQLEYYFGDALAQGADAVIITGAVQSNYVRTTAAAAAKLGLLCEVQLEERVPDVDDDYRRSGNVLLDRLFGARVHSFPEGEDESGADAAVEAIAERLRGEGRRPYVIYLSEGHRPLGALGYIDAADEILTQAAAMDLDIDALVVGSGSGSTHAGLLVGLRAAGSSLAVHGVCVRRDAAAQKARIVRVCRAVADELEAGDVISDSDVVTHDDWLAPGYGRMSSSTREALRVAARQEGLLLDPVYSAKCFAGVLGLARRGEFAEGANVVFVHTGGTPALFGYLSDIERL